MPSTPQVLPQPGPLWIHSSLAGNAQNTLAQPTVWLTIALTTVVCIMPVVAFRFLKLDLKPELSDTVRVHGCGSGHGVLALRRGGRTGP